MDLAWINEVDWPALNSKINEGVVVRPCLLHPDSTYLTFTAICQISLTPPYVFPFEA